MEIKSRPGAPVAVVLTGRDRLRLAVRQALNVGSRKVSPEQLIRDYVRSEIERGRRS